MEPTMPMRSVVARRALASRHAGWARTLAGHLATHAIRPNAVSVAGVAFAIGSAVAFIASGRGAPLQRAVLLVAAAACIQIRLLCNLLDGMLAVEHGLKSATGEIFNDLPDRVSDVIILVAAGYAIDGTLFGPALGWAAALAAVLTAYVRAFGGSLGLAQHFIGPMAKPHRMFTLTVAALLGALEAVLNTPPHAIAAGLVIIAAGSVVTALRRTVRLFHETNAR